jgi:hypothetical protein
MSPASAHPAYSVAVCAEVGAGNHDLHIRCKPARQLPSCDAEKQPNHP